MKIVAISDLHGFLEKPKNMPKGDILCICGDIVPLDYQNNIAKSIAWFCLEFVPWTDSLPYKKVLFVGGNHDFFLENLHKRPYHEYVEDVNGGSIQTFFKMDEEPTHVIKQLLPGNNESKHKLIYLCDNSIEIDGKIFYGCPWIADLSKWAFYLPENELSKKWEKIPKKVDVLMTHMPPKYADIGKVLQGGIYNTGTDYGSESLAKSTLKRDIKYAISGHVHSGAHFPIEYKEGCFMANVSIKNEDYQPQYYPLVFDI